MSTSRRYRIKVSIAAAKTLSPYKENSPGESTAKLTHKRRSAKDCGEYREAAGAVAEGMKKGRGFSATAPGNR
jgi:hypothetical protein